MSIIPRFISKSQIFIVLVECRIQNWGQWKLSVLIKIKTANVIGHNFLLIAFTGNLFTSHNKIMRSVPFLLLFINEET